MLVKFKALLYPPSYPDEETTRIAQLLHLFLLVFITASAVGLVALVLIDYYRTARTVLVINIAFVMAMWLMRRGWLTLSGLTIVITVNAGITYLLYIGEGIRDEGILVYPLIIIVASLILPRGWFILFVGLTFLSVLGVTWVQVNDPVWRTTIPPVSLNQAVTVSLVLGVTAVTTRLLGESLLSNLTRLVQNEKKLADLNRQLQVQTDTLRHREEEARQFQEKLQQLHEVNIILSQAPTMEQLCRQAIELGRRRLGFDRLGLLLFDESNNMMVGTFGTDPQGEVRDERACSLRFNSSALREMLTEPEQMLLRPHGPLSDFGQEVGHGWNALTVLWNGEKGIGWLAADNLIKQEPPSPSQLKILTLYSSMLGHLISRQQTDEELRYSEERHRMLLKASPVPIILYDPAGNVTYVNDAFSQTFGWRLGEIVGKPLDFVPEGSLAKAFTIFDKMIDSNGKHELSRFESKRLTKDGRLLDVEISGTRVMDQYNLLWGIVLLRDISEQKAARKALQNHSDQLEKMVTVRTKDLEAAQERLLRQEKLAFLGQLAGGVGHELRNPLGVISNSIYFLNMVLAGKDDAVHEHLQIISNSVKESEKIVSDLLNLSRTRSVERHITAVSTLIADTLSRHPGPDNITVCTTIAEALPVILVDAGQIRQVLTNLVINAYQAMSSKQDGELTITALADDENEAVQVTVRDNGQGMSMETMAKIFEPLFTTKVKGIGLGLAVSKNLVEVNNGRITVASQEGIGTTFTLTFPFYKAVV